jgi:hypothetical protein
LAAVAGKRLLATERRIFNAQLLSMTEKIEFQVGQYGVRAIIRSEWQEPFLQMLIEKEIKELELNTGKGWKGENVQFLRFLPGLKLLIILDQSLKSIEPVHFLTKLRSINISAYCKTPLDFTVFTDLTDCGFEWIKGSDALFNCIKLKTLGINNYDKTSSDSFARLVNLEKLTILNAGIESLTGLSALKKLNYLSVANLKKLFSLKGIEELQELLELELQNCKGIEDISPVFNLHKLKSIMLIDSGGIKSIKGLAHLKELETFLFYGTTNVLDGDLKGLLELKNLSKISFQNRKHYSNRREHFGKKYN